MPTPTDRASAEREVGGQWEWCWAVPSPYRVLAAPASALPMPVPPRATDDFMQHIGYWASLQPLLTFSFGWTRHDKGLIGWYDAGMPTDDPRLALLHRVWHRDGMLEKYLEWSVSQGPAGGPLRQWASRTDTDTLELSSAWRRRIASIRESVDPTALSMTPHGKHLEEGGHIGLPAAEGPGELFRRDIDSATLCTDHLSGWYGALVRLGDEAQRPRGVSVRIDVVVGSVCSIGQFRRSQVTGLWFAGAHRYHSIGN